MNPGLSQPGRGRDALVIGAGIGGIAVAVFLARAGYQVRVVEKTSSPGGRCRRLVKDGHTFDMGPTLYLMPEVYESVFSAMGERIGNHLELRRTDPAYRIFLPDGTPLDFTADLSAMAAAIEAIEPGSHRQLARYLEDGRNIYDLSLKHLIDRNYRSILDFINPVNALLYLRLKAPFTHYGYMSRYFRNPGLKAAMTFQNMYVGTNPFRAPATFSLLAYAELVGGVWFPRGGMYSVVESLVRIAKKNGVVFEFDSAVERICVDGSRASGVVMKGGQEYAADLVVANADLPYAYQRLLPDQACASRFRRERYTSSVITFYWGINRAYPELRHHSIILSREYERSFQQVERDKTLPDSPSIYVNAACRSEAGFAPPGHDSITAMVSVGHVCPEAGQDWGKLKARAREAVFKRLAEIGVADLEKHIKFEVAYTPPDWQDRFNISRGSVFGSLSHYPTQMGYLRPANRHPRYRNLYFVGGSTHPGSGVPLVLISARLTAERILGKDYAVDGLP